MDDDLGGEVVTTIRVINVPSHTTVHEFNCWFIFAEGFEQAKLVPTRGQGASQLGWARFSTVEAAEIAIGQLNGLQLSEYQSPEQNLLSAEFAKSNFRPTQGPAKRPAPTWTPPQAVAPPVVHIQPPPPAQPPPAAVYAAAAAAHVVPPPQPPCSTLFVGGLSYACTEAELQEFFAGTFNGFERLKFKPSPEGRAGVCWVKFVSPRFAQTAFQIMTDTQCVLSSNPNTPLTPEWSKNDLDAPRSEADAYVPKIPHTVATVPTVVPPARVVKAHHVVAPPPPPAVRVVQPPQRSEPVSSTLFVGGLVPAVTEEELYDFFASYFDGFDRIKYMVATGGKPGVCFAKFATPEHAQAAFQALNENGYTLSSNPSEVLRPEWARNDLDAPKRRR